MEELKPCPFCGGEAVIKPWVDDDDFIGFFAVCLAARKWLEEI